MEDYGKTIWEYFLDKIGNPYGVAGLMGNLQAESGLCPYRLQGDFSEGYTESLAYTEKVNSGEIPAEDFIYNGPNGGGYGLAQWTYSTRKQGLYNAWLTGGYDSIGNIDLACNYLWYELQSTFADVLEVLKTAKSVREASDKVLHDFENPADQSTLVEAARAALGEALLEKYTDSSLLPIYKKKMPLLLMWTAVKRW